jgi:DNA ligase-associated metallophosphoesterase
MSNAAIRFRGEDLLCDLSGALIWPAEETVIVSDMHLEKGSAFAERGFLLPPYDSRETLAALAHVLDLHPAKRVICLGDSFHDGSAFSRLTGDEERSIKTLSENREWIWIAGNHDPAPPLSFGGSVSLEYAIGPMIFRHIAETDAPAGEISGHYHPKARIPVRGRRLPAPCFIADESRLILPAFGAYTGGLDVLDPTIQRLFPGGFHVHMLGRRKVYSFPGTALRKARRRPLNRTRSRSSMASEQTPDG